MKSGGYVYELTYVGRPAASRWSGSPANLISSYIDCRIFRGRIPSHRRNLSPADTYRISLSGLRPDTGGCSRPDRSLGQCRSDESDDLSLDSGVDLSVSGALSVSGSPKICSRFSDCHLYSDAYLLHSPNGTVFSGTSPYL